MYMCIAESLCSTLETNTLEINYTSIKNESLKRFISEGLWGHKLLILFLSAYPQDIWICVSI